MLRLPIAWLACLIIVSVAHAGAPGFQKAQLSGKQFQAMLLKDRPRILLTDKRLADLKKKIKTTRWARTLERDLYAYAEELLKSKKGLGKNPPVWKIYNTRMKHVTTLALMWKLHGEKRFLKQAERELLLLVENQKFNEEIKERRRASLPQSSGILALGIGYDWLHDDLADETKTKIERAILGSMTRRMYDKDGKPQDFPDNNWRQVIWGGHAVAAIAIGDRYPEQASRLIAVAIPQTSGVTAQWRPDGVCSEGTHYWDFGAQYYTLMMDAFETGLGTDFGLSKWPVLEKTARWRVAARGPQGDFPYADGIRTNASCIPLSWWAMKSGRDWFVRTDDLKYMIRDKHQRWVNAKAWMVLPLVWTPPKCVDGTPPRDLLTFVGAGDPTSASRTAWTLKPRPGDRSSVGIVNVLYRSAWNDPRATWLAALGGQANVSHGHMHAGSFVLDMGGVRWVDEVGTHHYFNPHFRKAKIQLWEWGEATRRKNVRGREHVYAWGNFGHNTLTVDKRFHIYNRSATLSQHTNKHGSFTATLDMTAVLGTPVKDASRNFRVINNRTIEIQDTWQAGERDLTMTSRLHTRAKVKIEGKSATWTQDGKTLEMKVDGSESMHLLARPANEVLNQWDRPLPGITVVDVQVKTRPGEKVQVVTRFTLKDR